jgi:uncharacterized protein (TIGR01627 family)
MDKLERDSNFLVFGLSYDSEMWANGANVGGRTLFIEDNRAWIEKIRKHSPDLDIRYLDYESDMREAFSVYFGHEDKLMQSFPAYLKDTEWDVILVDAPMGGGGPNNPGRMKSIYWASQIIRGDGHVFVHDAERAIESRFSKRYLEDNLGRKPSLVDRGTLGGQRKLVYFAPAEMVAKQEVVTVVNSETRSLTAGVSAKKTVIIAAAINYGVSEFKNFVSPLRKVYTGDVVIFVNSDLPESVIELCKQHNVFTRALPTGSRLGVKGNRYIGYSEVCNDYHWCFATDFRDVFFSI